MYQLGLTKLPEHVREAIESYELRKDAFERAKRGAAWLDKHAPLDWRLQMMAIYDGKVSSRVRLPYDTENPISLAFRNDPEVNRYGRPEYRKAVDKFISSGERFDRLAHFGFAEKHHFCGDTNVDSTIDGYLLEEAWEKILCNLEWRECFSARKRAA